MGRCAVWENNAREATYLDQVLALSLSDQRLQLGRSEGVDKTSLGHDQQEDLGASQDGEFIGLLTIVCQ